MYILPKDFLDFSFGMTEKGTKKGSARHFCTDKAFISRCVSAYKKQKRRDSPDKEPSRRYILIRQEFQFMNVFPPIYKNNEQGLRW